jgi:3-hydroxyisobutyrate dehydrogenase-like beta-hydroxyacid dehydrogenase
MIAVLDASSGRSAATNDKFPNHVLTGRFAAGFANSLMDKDLRLYLEEVEDQRGPSLVGRVTAAVWERFAAEEPGADFTRIAPYIESGGDAGA